MNLVYMRMVKDMWGTTYKGFIFMNNEGLWKFQYYGKNGWEVAPLSEFCPA